MNRPKPFWPRLLRIVFWAVCVYFALGFAVVAFLSKPQRRFDPAQNPGLHGAPYQNVRFEARGGDAELAAWFLPQPKPNAALIMVHGKDGSRSREQAGRNPEFLAALHKQGFSVLAMDLRGHGESSEARFTFGGNEHRDVLGGFDFLKRQGFSKQRIGLHGVSMGAASVLMAAAREPEVRAVVADCSYADFGRLLQQQWSRRTHLPTFVMPASRLVGQMWLGQDFMAIAPAAEVPRIKGKVLFIHAEQDTLVPPADSQQMHDKLPGSELWIQPKARHAAGFATDPEAYLQKVSVFFTAQLRD